jgi:hypothetical protein
VLTHSILVKETSSKFVPLSAEGSTLDGLNVSCALIDELHAHKTPAVHDVLDSATGSRAQPLLVKITTAGSNREPVALSSTSCTAGVLCACSSSISAHETFRPSRVLPSADSGTNFDEVSLTRIECVST